MIRGRNTFELGDDYFRSYLEQDSLRSDDDRSISVAACPSAPPAPAPTLPARQTGRSVRQPSKQARPVCRPASLSSTAERLRVQSLEARSTGPPPYSGPSVPKKATPEAGQSRVKRAAKPDAALSNLFGLLDTSKILDGSWSSSPTTCCCERAKWCMSSGVRRVPDAPLADRHSSMGTSTINGSTWSQHEKEKAQRTSEVLFYGSICSFVSGVLLLMSYASPYWLQSWEDTDSPFKNMGLWEFCFYKFRHPDYQFDKLFHGCHALYGDEYRLIREKLLPGWLMVVQLFVTVALISSYIGQGVVVALLLRYPLEIILRFEWHFCGLAVVCKGFTAVLLFLSLCIFGGMCWDRDWLLYPNYNYVSWSYAFVVFACIGHIVAAYYLFRDLQLAKQRRDQNRALIMQMQPPGFSLSYQGSGYI